MHEIYKIEVINWNTLQTFGKLKKCISIKIVCGQLKEYHRLCIWPLCHCHKPIVNHVHQMN